MVTGDLWTRFEWGVWWTWDPRLTTYLILMLIIIAYFILRNAIDEPERRATYAPSRHHRAHRRADLLHGDAPHPLEHPPRGAARGRHVGRHGHHAMFCLVGIAMVGFALYRLRFRQVRLAERVEALKEQLED